MQQKVGGMSYGSGTRPRLIVAISTFADHPKADDHVRLGEEGGTSIQAG